MNLEGKLLGNRYEIIQKIGNGGMATVYKARCLVLKRLVAVKVLKEEYTTDNEFIKRFNIEAEAAASLAHSNIVSIYDVGQEGNLYYIVMELVKGKTLKDIIVEEGKLGWKWSIKVATQIASALEIAHKNNIIHRDIKPHNIIITEDGVAKVTDFGIAKAVSNSTITAFGTTIGSVHYFSPEHAKGGYTDAKSDLYSLGVVLYEMVTGRVPFDADTPVSVALKHMQEKPIEPINLNSSLPKCVNDIIMKAMQKEPSMRYATATEMKRDLEACLKNPDKTIMMNNDTNSATQKINVVPNTEKHNSKKMGKIKKFFDKHKIIKWVLIILILLIVFLASIFITLSALQKTAPKEVTLPNLAGLTLEEAKQQYVNLNIEMKEEKFDPEIEKGKIITQDPEYQTNYTINEGSTIGVTISKGQELVEVTKLIGKTKDEVMQEAKNIGFVLKIEEDYNDDVEAGIVVEQSIKEGEEILAGSEVTVKVSLGIEQVEVPDLTGLSEDDAKVKIAEAKLKWKTTYNTTDSSKAKGVVEQSISAHSFVDKNTEITITINDFQEMVTGTVNINISRLTGYTQKYEKKTEIEKDPVTGEEKEVEKEVAIPAPDVEVIVLVNDEQIEKKIVSQDTTEFSTNFDSKGTVTIKVIIDGSTKKTKTLNLNETTIITME